MLQSLAFISIAPIFLAVLMPAARERLPRIPSAWGISALLGLLLAWLTTFLPAVREGALEGSLPWVPSLGLTLSLYLDGLSLLFAMLIVGIGAVVALYAGYYFDDARELNRFYMLLLAFMSAMLALVLAGNVLTLFIAWELTSVVSFLLIGFYGETSAEARAGALRALVVTGGGGLALLVGLALLGTAADSMELRDILANTTLRENPWYTAFTVLIFAGCFAKSAQWPLHFWLPGAMSAPTPASAYLHSATMVKAGIYLLLRLYPALGDTALWQYGLMGFGLATMLVGALLALRQRDLKACLAYSTVSQLGALVALIGLPEGAGLKAALVGILAHSLYKAALFLTAGAVDHAAGTRDLGKLGGLANALPGWAAVALLAGLSMAGLPPLLGFAAKETLLDAMLESPLPLLIVVASAALTVAMACILVWDVFMGQRHDTSHAVHEPARGMLLAPTLLVGGALLAGLRLETVVTPLIQPALKKEVHLTLFSGFNEPFLLSLVAVAAGLGIFAARGRWRGWALPALPSGTQIYNALVVGVEKAGDLALRTQNGKLRYYLVVILGAVTLLQLSAGLNHITGMTLQLRWNGETDILRGLLLLLALGTMVASIFIRRHFMAALVLGVAGYSVGGLFLLEPAPDVALVQFMVETLGTVLLIIMLAKISEPEREAAMNNLWKQSRPGLLRDILIAVLVGGGVGLFALAAVNNRAALPNTITVWHLQNALPLLGFPDVVGAIVTDFRGMDTIIEITVFSVASLGALTLLSTPSPAADWPKRFKRLALRWNVARRGAEPDTTLHVKALPHETDEPEASFQSHFSTPLTRTIAGLVLPFALLVALSQLLYGGEGPGDGFTAGVISGLGVALWYIVFGYDEARRRLGWLKPRYLIGAGLTLVIANAAFPLLLGLPFLTHISFDAIHLPADLHLSTTLFYETGIFLTVLGSTSTIMEAIAYPKEVEAL
jgi:NADH:ubiquinone oxidoreductase subunit 5 (subunit L)/multisubunit Na+/H+ antiporter MnhA subunit/multisubunit Na+/H+ antiporter MnhB subunit